MSNLRSKGRFYLKEEHNIHTENFTTSKYYPEEQSFINGPDWWLRIPLKKLYDRDSDYILLCEKENGGFFHLSVPINYLLDNKSQFTIVQDRNGNDMIQLYLSAHDHDLFIDHCGQGKIDFSRWIYC